MPIFDKDIALDMGTTRVLLYTRGKGVQVREPALVAVDKFSGKLMKVGEEAQKMLGRTPASIVPIQPIVGGVISDYDMTVAMLRELMKRVTSLSLFKPRVLVCVPGSITGVEERAVVDAVTEAGARKVYLVESAVATAYGAGLDVSKPDGQLIIDVGGGTTETAVVSLGGVAECESIKTAGASFDEAIIRYIRRRHNVLIGEKTAEEVKMAIGCVVPRPDTDVEEVKGRDLVTGLPKTVKISSAELAEVLLEPMRDILEAIHLVLERTPARAGGRHLAKRHHHVRRRQPHLRHRPPGRAGHRHPHRRCRRPRLLRGLRRGQAAHAPERHERGHGQLRPQAYAERLNPNKAKKNQS